jgi:N-acetylneuraminic acid mutarotase
MRTRNTLLLAGLVLSVCACSGKKSDKDSTLSTATIQVGTYQYLAMNLNSQLALTAEGGSSPYSFSISWGAGSLDSSTGVFTTPSDEGSTTILVTDSAGATGTAVVSYRGTTLRAFGGYDTANQAYNFYTTNGYAWTNLDTLAATISEAQAVVFRNQIFLIGGLTTNTIAQIDSSTDGSTWSTSVGSLPAARSSGSVAVYNDSIWYAGGHDLNGSCTGGSIVACSEVFSSSDGLTWSTAGSLPFQSASGAMVNYNGMLWYAGGRDETSAYRDEVYTSTDGATWTLAGHLPDTCMGHNLLVFDEQLWLIGGNCTSGVVDGVYSSTDGATWTLHSTLPTALYNAGAVVFNGGMWVMGGIDSGGVFQSAVYFTPDGTHWSTFGALPAVNSSFPVVAFRPY